METTQQSEVDATDADDQPRFEHYLPAGPVPSTESSRFEEFVTNLFRLRGSYRLVVRTGE